MLGINEENYVRSLINTYKNKGYKYYLLSTCSDNNINADIYLYLSKDKINAITNNTFIFTNNSLKISIDSSNYYYNQRLDVLNISSIIGNSVVIEYTEFVYTNSDYGSETTIIYPDILFSNSNSYEDIYFNYITVFIVISLFIYIFLKSILRINR